MLFDVSFESLGVRLSVEHRDCNVNLVKNEKIDRICVFAVLCCEGLLAEF